MGRAKLSSRARLAAIFSGSPPVPDKYGPAMSIHKGRVSETVEMGIIV
jgi:hypothetical protein